jgi:hypothetical protein
MSASREEIINEIRKLAATNNGQPPGRRLFRRRTNIHPVEWCGVYWALWSDALKEAGFQPNLKTERLDEEFMLIKLAEACRHFGKFPSILELRLYRMSHREFPDVTTYVRHFGSPNLWPSHLALWGEKGGDLEVLRIVRELRDLHSPVVHGVVYLLKSGVNFKIGRSNDLMGRLSQLKTGQSNALVLVHTIATDDPPGIEAYWHRRFADRRIKGEWFKLNSADVSAFRRRRFQ